VVSRKDREHFANIARANAAEEAARRREAASRPPGENLRLALEFSDELLAIGPPEPPAGPPFSLRARWLALHPEGRGA
jgi:hypothetical protein